MDDLVSIERTYFNTLLRRAAHRASETSTDGASVIIPEAIHEDLIKDSLDYHRLRQALLHAGVSSKILEILTQGVKLSDCHDPAQEECLPRNSGFDSPDPETLKAISRLDHGMPHSNAIAHPYTRSSTCRAGYDAKILVAGCNVEEDSYVFGDLHDEDMSQPLNAVTPYDGQQKDHTLLLANLPESTTHRDVTRAVKGGRLVDIWLRKNEHTAAVTFAEGAVEFLHYAQTAGIYIKSKRIDVRWSDRQYTIAPHLRMKLNQGHSRNVVIRGALGRLTEEGIREDLDHIHNLVIVAILWRGPDAYISTNSINNATFARNCMISRLHYKSLKIDWYPDECAEPLPKAILKPTPVQRRVSAGALRPKSITNRFDLLSIDDADDSDSANSSTIDVDQNFD